MALNVLTATITDLEAALNKNELKSETLIEEYLSQIHANNAYLHAIISTAPKELLLKRARELDHERAENKTRGPLHGIPIVVKDNTATDPSLGMETTAGTYALVGSRVRAGAPFVNQLQEAGAIILAKANLSEMSNFRGLNMPAGWSAVGGLTQNPYVVGGKRWDDGFGGYSSAGGSSSGSAASVGAGFCPASIGTDTNGSLLMPTTRHDVYSMKPTLGLISQQGICPISFDFDSAGPIAKCARDVAVLMDALIDPSKAHKIPAGGYTSCLTKSFDGLRIGVLDPDWFPLPKEAIVPDEAVEAQKASETTNAYKKLENLGAVVKKVTIASLDELKVDGMSQVQRVMDSQFRRTIDTYLHGLETSKVRNLDELMQFMRDNSKLEFPAESPNMKRLEMAAAFQLSEEGYRKALADMRDFGRRRAVDKCLEEYGIDIILGPGESRMNELSATPGYPIAMLPLSYLKLNKRPFGLAAVASEYQEGKLIQLMSAWEQHFNLDRELPTWVGGDPKGAKSEL